MPKLAVTDLSHWPGTSGTINGSSRSGKEILFAAIDVSLPFEFIVVWEMDNRYNIVLIDMQQNDSERALNEETSGQETYRYHGAKRDKQSHPP